MTVAAAADDTRQRRTVAWQVPLAIVFGAMFVWTAVGSNGTYDTYRDIFMATSIVTGTGFPLNGPTINNIMHLGPAWFYVLALPLWLIRNPAVVNATMGLLCALQFPLAYAIGRRFGGTRLGLLFALALALPGWSAFPLVMLTHASVVPTCVLFGALAVIRYRERPGAARAFVLGLAIACMLHAHPTTLFLAALCAWAAAPVAPRGSRALHAMLAVAAVCAAFAPMLVNQALNGWPDFATASAYATSRLALPAPARVGKLLLALFDYGADYVTRFWLAAPKPVLRLLLILNALYFAGTLAGLALVIKDDAQRRRWVAALLGILLAQTLFVVALRELTPYWMIHAHLPVIAALVALGLHRLCASGPTSRSVVAAIALSWSLWSMATWHWLATSPWHGLEGRAKHERHGLMDVIEHETIDAPFVAARIPVRELFELAADCVPATLYGHYAYFVDSSFGVGALQHCGSAAHIRLGGMPDVKHPAQLGLCDYTWQRIGLQPQRRVGSLGISEPSAVWQSPQSIAVVKAVDYPPRQPVIAPKAFVVDGTAPGGDAIVVSNRMPGYGPFRLVAAKANGTIVQPVWEDQVTTVLRAPPELSNQTAVAWSLQIESTPDFVDVVTVR